MILFLNFAPLSYGGGAERWMLEMAQQLKNKEEISLLEVDEKIGNLYSRLVLKRNFDQRQTIDPSIKINRVSLSSLIPFTTGWREVKRQLAKARIIYTKFEVNEFFLLVYFGGRNILSKTVIGTHSPLKYEHEDQTFFERLHNFIYLSKFGASILSQAKLVHVLTDAQKIILKELNVKRIVQISNYIEKQSKLPRRNASSILKVGFLGELNRRKGVDVLLEVIKNSSNSFLFEIIGDGPGKDAILQLEKPNVRYHGFIAHEKTSKALDKLDVLLLPSRAEGFSLSCLEAMSHGVVVASSKTSTPDNIKDFVAVNPTNSPNGYLKILNKLYALKLSSKLSEISRKVWQFTNERYSKEIIMNELSSNIFFAN